MGADGALFGKQMTLQEIARLVEGELIGDGDQVVTGIASSGVRGEGKVTFVVDARHLDAALLGEARCVILTRRLYEERVAPSGSGTCPSRAFILVENPRLALARLLSAFAPQMEERKGIHPTSIVSPDAAVGRDAYIGAYAVVEAHARIGDGVKIFPGVYIGENVSIGDNSLIYPNVVIRENVVIGKRVIIHPGSVIGADGFGYVQEGERRYKIPQVGSVVIEDDVEIGANACIDRATLEETRIGSGTKIDNLVQIGHNVLIGRNVAIAGQTGVAGSSRLGDGVTVGGQVAISDHVVIGEKAMVGGRSCVWGNLPPGGFVSGDPARPHRDHLREEAAKRKLPEVLRRLEALEERLKALERIAGIGVLVFLLIGAFLTRGASACVGARPLSMGGAFVAVAAGSSATYWNPAGLGEIKGGELEWTHTLNNRELYNYHEYFSLARGLGDGTGLGIAWINQGLFDDRWGADWLVLSYGFEVERDTFLGANLRHEDYRFRDSDGVIGGSRLGIDIGVIHRSPGGMRLGLLLQDANGGAVLWSSGETQQVFPNVRPGLAWEPNPRSLLSLELYDTFDGNGQRSLRVGGEFKINDVWSLRAGYYGTADGALTLGASVNLPSYVIDYAYLGANPFTGGEGLGGTHQLGMRVRF